ncbi:MAG: glycosyltransferase [Flavobacteriales bacterium]|nr:glycosyltransferase [Flavobacteriales bacterium]MCB9363089.1 glycosyltransferase [Flavobacteriales bacterium]
MFVLLIILVLFTTIYSVLVVVALIGFYKIKNIKEKKSGTNNKISVVIAARNEERNIERCIESLITQDFDVANYEIIVVNDHSEDNTLSILRAIRANNLVVFSLPKGITSKKEALKYGIEKAQYNTIASTDADCILPNNWLKTIATNIDENTDMLLGPIMFIKEKGFLNAFQQLDMMAMQTFEFGMLHFNKPILNNGANLSFKTDKYYSVDGFDKHNTPSGDDVFLLEKFNAQNFSIKGILNRHFIVETKATTNSNDFLHQRIRWASKSKFYKGRFLQFISISIFFQNIIQLFIYYQVLLSENFTAIYIFLLLSKWLIDFILLFLVATFFDKGKSLLYFIPVQIIYPFYIMGVSVASMFLKFEWKGRKY